jgi:hypothetical protein
MPSKHKALSSGPVWQKKKKKRKEENLKKLQILVNNMSVLLQQL